MRIKSHLYPVIIWAVFVLFLIIGLRLGFTPEGARHGGTDSGEPGAAQSIRTGELHI